MQNSIFKDKAFWLLFIFASIYILGNVGMGSLTTWDEALYAIISKNILKTGTWLVLFEQGEPWFDKPPLYMWVTAFFYKIFGINEFAVRLGSGLSGIAAVLIAYMFIKNIYNKNAAIFAALILLAMPHFLHFSKMGMMDAAISFAVFLMIYLFWLGREKPGYLFLSGAALALGYYIKGFAAFSGLFIIIIYCIFAKDLRYLFKRQFILGILFSLLCIFLWHLFQYIIAGPDALKKYFVANIFERAVSTLQGHTGGINFYQKAIFNKNKPWSILAYMSFFYILWQALRYKDKRAILLCCWAVTVFVFYTAIRTKIHWYIMPIYPALAISSAVFLDRFLKNKAFNFALASILIIMLIQVPVSWAFKVDFCPNYKKAAGTVKQMYNAGAILYFYGAHDNKEVFYLGDFLQFLSYKNRPTEDIISSKAVYCVLRLNNLKQAEKEYGYNLQPIEYIGDIVIAGIKARKG